MQLLGVDTLDESFFKWVDCLPNMVSDGYQYLELKKEIENLPMLQNNLKTKENGELLDSEIEYVILQKADFMEFQM